MHSCQPLCRSCGQNILSASLPGSRVPGTTDRISIGLDRASDDFGRLDGALLFDIPGGARSRSPAALSYRDLEALPPVLPDERAPFVIVKTDQGNLAKILVSGAFKKLAGNDQEAESVPVLILERFETIDAGDRKSFKARGKGVTLFDGFQFDLDSGQVVPDRAGGDVRFTAQGPSEPRLTALGASRLYVLEKPVAQAAPEAGRPSGGRTVLPGDFNGRFDLVADGQWSGRLELTVDAAGAVSGFFRSEKNGSSYPVIGKAGDAALRGSASTFDFRAPPILRRTDLERRQECHCRHRHDARPHV